MNVYVELSYMIGQSMLNIVYYCSYTACCMTFTYRFYSVFHSYPWHLLLSCNVYVYVHKLLTVLLNWWTPFWKLYPQGYSKLIGKNFCNFSWHLLYFWFENLWWRILWFTYPTSHSSEILYKQFIFDLSACRSYLKHISHYQNFVIKNKEWNWLVVIFTVT